jgi:hypothetical protein
VYRVFTLAERSTPPPPPPASAQIKQLLAKDQTVINTYYMGQLLKHAFQMGEDKKGMSQAELTAYASVCLRFPVSSE